MQNLIYLSSASYLFSEHDLLDILNKSRSNNTALNVTGLLLYCDGSILQILEGEQNVLDTLYKKIGRDQRHRSLIKMVDCSIGERSFSDWSMGFKQISIEDWAEVTGYLNVDKNESYGLTATANSHVITMIKSFENVNMLNKRSFTLR